MRTLAFVTLALAGLASTAAVPPALADIPAQTPGLLCQFATFMDPTAAPGTQVGELSGGPALLTEQDGVTPESGTLTCRIQLDEATHAGTGPSVSGHGTGVVTAGPGTVTWVEPPFTNVHLCTEFTDDSDAVTYYWDDSVGAWSTDINSRCDGFQDPPRDPEPDTLLDAIVCPVLAQAFPPEGDVVLPVVGPVWDCPPYGNV